MVFLGIDGGGSSLRARARDEGGRLLFDRKAGPGSWTQTPRDVLSSRIVELLDGCPVPNVAAAGLAGVLTEADKVSLSQMVSAPFSGRARVIGASDWETALWAAPHDSLALVIAGTGSLACSLKEGRGVKTSGNGPLLGDPGSVYSVCRRVMGMNLRRPGRWPSSGLEAILTAFDAASPEEAVAKFYALEDRAPRACRLITWIAEQWETEPRVREAAKTELEGLAQLLTDHLEEHSLPRFGAVAVMGGLWEALPPSLPLFSSLLPPGLAPAPLTREPVEGAILMAQSLAESRPN